MTVKFTRRVAFFDTRIGIHTNVPDLDIYPSEDFEVMLLRYVASYMAVVGADALKVSGHPDAPHGKVLLVDEDERQRLVAQYTVTALYADAPATTT